MIGEEGWRNGGLGEEMTEIGVTGGVFDIEIQWAICVANFCADDGFDSRGEGGGKEGDGAVEIGVGDGDRLGAHLGGGLDDCRDGESGVEKTEVAFQIEWDEIFGGDF